MFKKFYYFIGEYVFIQSNRIVSKQNTWYVRIVIKAAVRYMKHTYLRICLCAWAHISAIKTEDISITKGNYRARNMVEDTHTRNEWRIVEQIWSEWVLISEIECQLKWNAWTVSLLNYYDSKIAIIQNVSVK